MKEEECYTDEVLKVKLNGFIVLCDIAIDIVKKYIEKFKKDPEYELTVEDLTMGLKNLCSYREFFISNPDYLLKKMYLPTKKRPGLGFGRGFGEFLRALPKEDEWWADEIMDAVHAIEKYFRNM